MSLVFPTHPSLRLFLHPNIGVAGDVRFPLIPYLDTYMSLESHINHSTLTAGLQPRYRPFSFLRLQLTPMPLLTLHLPYQFTQCKSLRIGGILRLPWHKNNWRPAVELRHGFSIWGILGLRRWSWGERERFLGILDDVDKKRAMGMLEKRLRTFRDGYPKSLGIDRGREYEGEDGKFVGGRVQHEGDEMWDHGLPVGKMLKDIMKQKRMEGRRGADGVDSGRGEARMRKEDDNKPIGHRKENELRDPQDERSLDPGQGPPIEELLSGEGWDDGLPVGKRLKEIMKEKRMNNGRAGFMPPWGFRRRVRLGCIDVRNPR